MKIEFRESLKKDVPMDYQVEHVIPKTGMVGQVPAQLTTCAGALFPFRGCCTGGDRFRLICYLQGG